jgi:iron uptake system component EfeO
MKFPRNAVAGAALCAALVGVGAGACSAKDGGGETVSVVASDTACALSKSTIASGAATFVVENKGGDVTEVYVYGPENKIMGEVENVGPGTTRSFTAKLGGGAYEVACKPGQKGDGIRENLEVTGATEVQAAPDRSVMFTTFDHGYDGLGSLSAKEGETIRFVMTNNGTVQHEFEILDPSGSAIGEIGPTDPGGSGELVVTFANAGDYSFVCGIAGHEAMGMKGSFAVKQ